VISQNKKTDAWINLDSESVTRNKETSAKEHLEHLLRVGWSPQSKIIRDFAKKHKLTLNNKLGDR